MWFKFITNNETKAYYVLLFQIGLFAVEFDYVMWVFFHALHHLDMNYKFGGSISRLTIITMIYQLIIKNLPKFILFTKFLGTF